MRISVVTPSFNQAQFIRRTIDSILGQTGDFELDYRVIDGGSTDGTIEILESYGDRLRWKSERDNGQVDAINKGLRETTGDVVGWVNSDDILLPGALARVAAAFEAHPEREWVHGYCKIIDRDDREVRRWVSAYKAFRARHHTLENFLTENYVSQMTAFWRRSVHDEIGYVDPTIRFAFDYDLFVIGGGSGGVRCARVARRQSRVDPASVDCGLRAEGERHGVVVHRHRAGAGEGPTG